MDDRTFRISTNAAILSTLGFFWPQIKSGLLRIGYREGQSETGWRRALKVVGVAVAISIVAVLVSK